MRLTLTEFLMHEARLKHKALLKDKRDSSGEGCADESKLHDQIIAECRHRGWWFSHSRMDRRTTTALGSPDFLIFADRGRTFAIECKTAKGKLTREQEGVLHWLQNLGHKACVVRSLDEFLKAINNEND